VALLYQKKKFNHQLAIFPYTFTKKTSGTTEIEKTNTEEKQMMNYRVSTKNYRVIYARSIVTGFLEVKKLIL
jgi:hypothetical protein